MLLTQPDCKIISTKSFSVSNLDSEVREILPSKLYGGNLVVVGGYDRI
jgi:hypothetical protein